MKNHTFFGSVGTDCPLSASQLKLTLLATMLAAIFILTAAVPACADTFSGGIVLQGQTFDPYHPDAPPAYKTLYTNPGVITMSLQKAWFQRSDDICTSITGVLSKPNALGKGYSPYNITCSMGDGSQMQIGASAITDGIHLTLTIPGNNLAFTTTQPTICGSDCDPRFSIAYAISVGMDVRGTGTKITVSNIGAKIQNAKVTPLNLAAVTIEVFAGQQALNGALAQVNYHGADLSNLVNSNLGALNAVLGGFAQQNGYKHLAISLETGQVDSVPPTSVLLQLSPDKFSIPQGNGRITGAIRWDSKAGSPAGCGALGIVARATSGFQQQGQLMPPQTAVGSVQFTTLVQNGGVSECDYVITGLPYNVPLAIDATVNGFWNGPAANELKSARPDGWTGHVTVEQPFMAQAQLPIKAQPVNMGQALAPAPVSSNRGTAARATFVKLTQSDPHGSGTVAGIDFAVQFQQAPH